LPKHADRLKGTNYLIFGVNVNEREITKKFMDDESRYIEHTTKAHFPVAIRTLLTVHCCGKDF